MPAHSEDAGFTQPCINRTVSFRTVEAAAAASQSDPAIPEAWRGKRCFVVGEKTATEVGRTV